MTPETLSPSQYRSLVKKKRSKYRSPANHRNTTPKPGPEKQHIELALRSIGVPYEREYRFSPDRRFRADWAIPASKILIEYEGLIYNNNRRGSTGISGHTTISGYISNCEKYNLATILGFRILRYTAKTYMNIYGDLMKLIG